MSIRKKKLFGAGIEVNCEYCQNSVGGAEEIKCAVGKSIKNGKCRKFEYNPTLRIPKPKMEMPVFTPEDFKL